MKKTNALIFILCAAFVVAGVLSADFWRGIGSCAYNYVCAVSERGFVVATENFVNDMEKTATEKIGFHDFLVDFNSAFLRIAGAEVVEKEDATVVRTASGTLANPRPYMADHILEKRADNVANLYEAAKENGTQFVYVMAPTKGYALRHPKNIEDFTKSNCDRFVEQLRIRNIPILNLIDTMASKGIGEEELFFETDHHWRPRYAFDGAWQIADYLASEYGFDYDKSLADIENYEVTNLEDYFLGSQGKKAGRFFAKGGADDIEIILPAFDTDIVEEQPAKASVRKGEFKDTVMYMENVSEKDYYRLNPYATYSGGDFREQIITNNLNPDGSSILLVRDSFSCAMAPFLALGTSRTTCIDVRSNAMYVGDKINVYEYIEKTKPDYLVIMYTGVSAGDDLFDFE